MTASVTVSEIDFVKTCYSVAPLIFGKLREKSDPGLAVKFINKLGMDGLPVILNILNGLSETEKNELVVWGINSFSDKIASVIKTVLTEYSLNEAVSFSELCARLSNGKIEISVFGLVLDYGKLAGSKPVAEKLKLGRFGSLLGSAGKALEGPVLKLLNSPEIKSRILSFAVSKLEMFGIYIKLSDFYIDRSASEPAVHEIAEPSTIKLPARLEEKIIDSAVSYIKKQADTTRK